MTIDKKYDKMKKKVRWPLTRKFLGRNIKPSKRVGPVHVRIPPWSGFSGMTEMAATQRWPKATVAQRREFTGVDGH